MCNSTCDSISTEEFNYESSRRLPGRFSKDGLKKWPRDRSQHGCVNQTFATLKTVLIVFWILSTLYTVWHIHGAGFGEGMIGLEGSRMARGMLGGSKGLSSTTSRSRPSLPSLLKRMNSVRRIPLPQLPNKVSVVLMNYSRPRMIRESNLMRTLLAHPNVGEIVLLHSNPKTRFEFVHEKIVNVDAAHENDEMGLSLRFYFCQMVKYNWVIHVDDDMEFDADAISEMLIEFGKNPRRIVGRFGRDFESAYSAKNGYNGLFGYNGYSSISTHKQTEVVLTKLMIMERDICSSFFKYAHLIWDDIVLKQGEGPLWNGEDIFMSLVANHVYGTNNNYAMDWLKVENAPNNLKDYDNGELDISGGHEGFAIWNWKWWQSFFRRNRHYSYRGKLWEAAKLKLEGLKQEESEDLEKNNRILLLKAQI